MTEKEPKKEPAVNPPKVIRSAETVHELEYHPPPSKKQRDL